MAHAAPSNSPELGERIAEIAQDYRDKRPALSLEACNGLVLDILDDAGVSMKGRVSTLWDRANDYKWTHRRTHPSPGDLVFFHRTYDSNRNGKIDDRWTHIAVVIAVDENGTIDMVHRATSGIKPLRMNLHHPDTHRVDKVIHNDYLAARGYGHSNERLAGQLFAGFATVASSSQRAPAMDTPVPPVRSTSTRPRRIVPVTPRQWSELPASTRRATLKGRSLNRRQLNTLSCEQLWAVRNAVFARHGYAFASQRARRFFDRLPWYTRRPDIDSSTVSHHLTPADRQTITAVIHHETKHHCP